jgi:outer membrane protein TolC
VVELPIRLPSGGAPTAPKDQYDASLNVDQLLLDPSRRARISAERSRLAEAQARIRTTLYVLRQEVNEAFFAAALLQEREAQMAASIENLEGRLREAKLRVNAGTALPSEAASIEATLLQRREDRGEMQANRRAALERLSKITGRDFSADERLAIPALGTELAQARASAGDLRNRPEFAQLAAARERLESQKELTRAEQQPRVSAYGKLAYGKPGLNFLRDDFHPYWLAGVRLQWKPWDWGKSERDRRIAELQQESIAADEAALARTLERSIQNDLAAADRLQGTLSTDDRIVELRELIERETRARYDERVVTAADYVEKESDVLLARLLRAAHRVELAQAQARVLNSLGVEIH